jgi:CMP-N,N'-diacetyllegionaminic acid synthase
MSPRVLGVIPARAGSKRVKNKNLRILCGKPLIAWTIEAAQKATKLTDWVVSTESHEIAQVANAYGAFVVKRPPELAEDHTTSGAVLRHALDWMEDSNGVYDVVVCLHPTSPIRDPAHIDEAIERLWASYMPTLASVCELPGKKHKNIGVLDDWDGNWAGHAGPFYILNASIYAMRRDWLLKNGRHTADVQEVLVMDRAHSMDIDEEIDLKIAEMFLADMVHAEVGHSVGNTAKAAERAA